MVRAMVVDDSRIMRMVIRGHLKQCGLQDGDILEAANGQEALDALDRDPVQLVVSDVNMPIMDGEQLITWLAESGFFTGGHAVMVTSRYERHLFRRLLHGGASTIIRKPFSLESFMRQMEPVLQEIKDDGGQIPTIVLENPTVVEPSSAPRPPGSPATFPSAVGEDPAEVVKRVVPHVLGVAQVHTEDLPVEPDQAADFIVAEIDAAGDPACHLLFIADAAACDTIGEKLTKLLPTDDDLRADTLGELANITAGVWNAALGRTTSFSTPRTGMASGGDLVWEGLTGFRVDGGGRLYVSLLR